MSDYTQKNIEHFDKRAATYDASVFKTGLQAKAVDAILSTQGVKWDPNSTVVVDFACGTGLISEGLVSRVHRVIGLDTSQAMCDIYNEKASKAGISEKMHAVCKDILAGSREEIPDDAKDVDVVVCSMGYHHIQDTKRTTEVLASLLKKGGYLIVLDLLQNEISHKFHHHLLPKEGEGHRHHHGHHHHDHGHHCDHHESPEQTEDTIAQLVPHIGGLSIASLEETFNSTGMLDEITAQKAFVGTKDGTDFDFVLATARRI